MNEKRQDSEFQNLLLGYHLGLTDASENTLVEASFSNPDDLAAARRKVEDAVAPLAMDEVASAPKNLVASIMTRIDAERGIYKFQAKSPVRLSTESEIGPGSGPLLPLRELVGLAAAILLFVGILVPGYRTAQSSSQRAICANNMRQLGIGYQNYAEANSAFLPYIGAAPKGASWVPANRNGDTQFSNSQHAYLLVKYDFVPATAFVCPGRIGDFPMLSEDHSRNNDFPTIYNNSYTSNMVTSPWRQQEFQPSSPLAADMTPLVDNHRNLIREEEIPLNSSSHRKTPGQNVLGADISVKWTNTPNVGVESDDIYRVIGVHQYTGQERPQLRSDAFLVP